MAVFLRQQKQSFMAAGNHTAPRKYNKTQDTRLILQRAQVEPGSLRPGDILQLQRTIGNRATGRLLSAAPAIQTKMEVGPVNDVHEQEADRVAREVVRRTDQPDAVQGKPAGNLQRQPLAPQITSLQRASDPSYQNGGALDGSLEQSIRQAKGGGQAMDRKVQRQMESGFGASFGGVRIHRDAMADKLTHSVQAKAFTTGQDIFFKKGAYNPGSRGGKELLAHELTHTVQQGGSDLQRDSLIRRDFLVQRDDEPGLVGNAVGLGDIGGAIVEVYEAYSGDESANAIVKAVTQLSGGIADTKGGAGDAVGGLTGEGIGAWSSMIGGVTSLAAKGGGLMSSLADYGRSALDYVSSFGYGSSYLGQMSAACTWLGGWAKSASDLVNPYAFYTDLVASGSKAVTGIADGWKAGTALYDLADLVKQASNRETKKAAELLFNMAWWKRVEGYSKSAVGAVEGSAAIFLSPLSKGLTTVMTKAFEGGWSSYLLRAIGSSFTTQVYSNAQVKQQVSQDGNALAATAQPIAAAGKIKDIVALCKAAIRLGMADFAKSILAAFTQTANSGSTRHTQRKQAFVAQLQREGLAKSMGL